MNSYKMNMRRTGIAVVLLAMLPLWGAESSLDYHFRKGNEFYLDEDYLSAVQQYEAVLANGYGSGVLHYNLGNAYYKLGRLGKAILNYERALKLLPNNENVRFNLKLTRLKVKDRIDVPPEFFLFRWNRQLYMTFSSLGWGRLFTLCLLLFSLVTVARWIFDPGRFRSLLRSISGGLAVLGVLLLIPFGQRYFAEVARDSGIVVTTSAKCLAAPHAGSTELFIVHEGTKVSVLEDDQEWTKIELIDGKQGWTAKKNVEVI